MKNLFAVFALFLSTINTGLFAENTITEERCIELLSKLISLPSITVGLASEEEKAQDLTNETRISHFLVEYLKANGIKEATIEETNIPGRPNVVAQIGNEKGPTLIFAGHHDTVSANGMKDPFGSKIFNGKIFGRGAYDMKGGLASQILAFIALAQNHKLQGKIILAILSDEEQGNIGAYDFARKYRGDAVIVAEPTNEELFIGQKGLLWADLTVKGVAAHASMPEKGKSAIAEMAPILHKLTNHIKEVSEKSHPLAGNATMHIPFIKGGVEESTFAPECTIKIERRILPEETFEEVIEGLQNIIKAANPEAEIFFDPYHQRPGMVTDENSLIVQSILQAIEQNSTERPTPKGAPFWTDAGILSSVNQTPALIFGPKGSGAHEKEEYVEIDSVIRCAKIFVDTANTFFLKS